MGAALPVSNKVKGKSLSVDEVSGWGSDRLSQSSVGLECREKGKQFGQVVHVPANVGCGAKVCLCLMGTSSVG